jgi:tRNA (guanine9-N1)-methyltransferase
VSLCSQLAYTYSANRQASFPFSLIYASLNGRTFDRLESMGDAGYKRWTNAKWWSEGYSQLWESEDIPQSDTETGCLRPTDGEKEDPSISANTSSKATQTHPKITRNNTPKSTVVYLTADSEDELSELRPDETYIIGGICDHNRYKVTLLFFSDSFLNVILFELIRTSVSIKPETLAFEQQGFPSVVILHHFLLARC